MAERFAATRAEILKDYSESPAVRSFRSFGIIHATGFCGESRGARTLGHSADARRLARIVQIVRAIVTTDGSIGKSPIADREIEIVGDRTYVR